MKTLRFRRTACRLLFVAGLSAYFVSCQKGGPGFHHDPNIGDIDTSGAVRPFDLNAVLDGQPAKQSYNSKPPMGLVKFRQNDTAHNVHLYTWLIDLQPNHTYLLQRAVNPIADNSCNSTAWLTLGKGLTPQSIHTDAFGYGYEELFRNLSAVPSGTAFWIHFQIVDSVSQATVLTSDCYSYTVK